MYTLGHERGTAALPRQVKLRTWLDRAVLVLERARDLGFSDVEYARTDADLAALHGHPGFERWLSLGKSASA